eukprot:823301-Pelagomonas_calceolata.AAC.3
MAFAQIHCKIRRAATFLHRDLHSQRVCKQVNDFQPRPRCFIQLHTAKTQVVHCFAPPLHQLISAAMCIPKKRKEHLIHKERNDVAMETCMFIAACRYHVAAVGAHRNLVPLWGYNMFKTAC